MVEVRFPALEEIKRDYASLMELVGDVRTIEGAKMIQPLIESGVKINGMSLDEFENGEILVGGGRGIPGKNEDIKQIQYGDYGCLGYIDVFPDGPEPRFYVYPDGARSAFLVDYSISELTEEEYKDGVESFCEFYGLILDDKMVASVNELIEDAKTEKDEAKMEVLLVKPGMRPQRVVMNEGYKDLRKAVGGDIECVYPFEDRVGLVTNGDGKNIGLELNRVLRDDNGEAYDIIAGNFVVVGLGAEDFASLSSELMDKYEKLFWQPESFLRVNGKIHVLPVPDDEIRAESVSRVDNGVDFEIE